jgi:hypothetical protein
MKKVIFGFCLATTSALACPGGQHSECIIPKPWGGCAQKICVPNIDNPLDALQKQIENEAYTIAITARENETIKDRQDCVVLVATALAVWGTAKGGPFVGLASGAAGGAAASLACRKVFPI